MPKKPQVYHPSVACSKSPRARLNGQQSYGVDTLTVVVGPDQCEHTVHKDLLCEKSPYFSAATRDCWQDDQEGRVPLPNDDPAIFALYLQWLNRRRIFCRRDMGDTGGNREEIGLLIQAFTLGEKLQDQEFRDAVVDCLIDAVDTPDGQDKRWYPSPGAIDRAYRGTPEGSPLRRLLVDMYFFHGRREWLDEATHADFFKRSRSRVSARPRELRDKS